MNDLLTGERISETNYQINAEDNMRDLISRNEKIVKELRFRGWLTVVFGIIVLIGAIYASSVMADHGLYGIPQMATGGLSGFIGVIIANGLTSIIKGRKLLR